MRSMNIRLSIWISQNAAVFAYEIIQLKSLRCSGLAVGGSFDAGEHLESRFGALMRDADMVTFVPNSSSACSEICARDAEDVEQLGKRFPPAKFSASRMTK